VDTRGFELAGELNVSEQWKLDASVTNAKSEIASTGGQLRNRPEWRGGFGAHWAPNNSLKLSASATYVGESFDSSIATGDVELDAYTRIDVSAVWQVSPRVETYLTIDNLTDEQYEQFVGFVARGIVPRAGVKLSF
ncbi:MAG: TonB-dependent receptor, partial [Peristeroidobacter soli]